MRIGSSDAVSGWISMSSLPSSSDRPLERENFIESLSPYPLSIGDHPATLPAMIPAMTVVAPKAELDRDLLALRLRDSGECEAKIGELKLSSCWNSGVCGRESLEREPLLERGSKASLVSCILNLRLFNLPPLTFLRKLSSSLTSAKGLGKRKCSSSSEMVSSGLLGRLFKYSGTSRRRSSSGMRRITAPIGIERKPRTIEYAHWAPLRRTTLKAFPPTNMIMTWPPTITQLIAIKNQLRVTPSKILNLLSRRRLLVYVLIENEL